MIFQRGLFSPEPTAAVLVEVLSGGDWIVKKCQKRVCVCVCVCKNGLLGIGRLDGPAESFFSGSGEAHGKSFLHTFSLRGIENGKAHAWLV